MTKGKCVGMTMKYLLVASTEACSGKSATILGIADRLQEKGIEIAYAQPVIAVNATNPRIDGDVQLMAQALSLPAERLGLPLLGLDTERTIDRLTGVDCQDYTKLLKESVRLPGNLVILEGGANLHEGSLFDLATAQVAEALDAGVLIVNRYHPISSVDLLLSAQQQLGEQMVAHHAGDHAADGEARAEDACQGVNPINQSAQD